MSATLTLHEAAIQGDKDSIELLLRSGVDVNVVDERGQTALQLATKHGHLEVV